MTALLLALMRIAMAFVKLRLVLLWVMVAAMAMDE